jgi:hypothetical protein
VRGLRTQLVSGLLGQTRDCQKISETVSSGRGESDQNRINLDTYFACTHVCAVRRIREHFRVFGFIALIPSEPNRPARVAYEFWTSFCSDSFDIAAFTLPLSMRLSLLNTSSFVRFTAEKSLADKEMFAALAAGIEMNLIRNSCVSRRDNMHNFCIAGERHARYLIWTEPSIFHADV